MDLSPNNLAALLKQMAKDGVSAYSEVDGEAVHDIPCTAIRGRAGNLGKTFSGYIDLETGNIRLDCAECPEFWLEINLQKVPCMSLQPPESGTSDGGEGYTQAKKEFESASRRADSCA
jgi:hypothetical protein